MPPPRRSSQEQSLAPKGRAWSQLNGEERAARRKQSQIAARYNPAFPGKRSPAKSRRYRYEPAPSLAFLEGMESA
jgi:hypothetical protein